MNISNVKLENDSVFWKVLLSVLLLSLQDSRVPSLLVPIKIRPLSGSNCCHLSQTMVLANADYYYWFLFPVFERQRASSTRVPFNKSHPLPWPVSLGALESIFVSLSFAFLQPKKRNCPQGRMFIAQRESQKLCGNQINFQGWYRSRECHKDLKLWDFFFLIGHRWEMFARISWFCVLPLWILKH